MRRPWPYSNLDRDSADLFEKRVTEVQWLYWTTGLFKKGMENDLSDPYRNVKQFSVQDRRSIQRSKNFTNQSANVLN
jgi:hypothetical protein